MINPEVELQFNISESLTLPGTYRVTWRVPAGLSYFEGHFPGFSVLPGVGTLDVTLEAVRRSRSLASIRLRGIRSAKFLQPVRPGDEVEIALAQEAGEWRARWKVGATLVAELAFRV